MPSKARKASRDVDILLQDAGSQQADIEFSQYRLDQFGLIRRDGLNARLRPEDSRYRSEQIEAQLLREALSDPSCQALMYHDQVKLDQVASPSNPDLTQPERAFMKRASCDFVIYFKVGKTPVGVIEVDGGTHDRPDQAARDALKDDILEKSRIRILRLRTVESRITERIGEFIAQWASPMFGA
ncbi:DUF2726 domain-containing protein [Pseudomonas lopnurensis]|uniref:DUF2726 domain-containing protein n=1 Tax=Pseudomonas lopnurensis TaxID=1477517 RepID=UPI0028ACDD51|nr:DUF2726 domain-containing protein [Pseudomonas lopnurensis]